jgi:hypothetical protein
MPPYLELAPVRTVGGRKSLPPVNIVLASAATSVIVALAALTVTVLEWPWVVPCVAVPAADETLDGPIMIVAELRDRLVLVKSLPARSPLHISDVLKVVRQRGTPNAIVLARWIAKRLRLNELEPLLIAQFREALDGVPATESASISTFCRHFARLGVFTARDWRALAQLCAHAATPPGLSCAHVRLSSRMVTAYTKKYVGMLPRDLGARIGWEWVAETALRLANYV